MRANLPAASPELRALLVAELVFASAGAVGTMVPYFHHGLSWPGGVFVVLFAMWVLLPYGAFASAAVVGYRQRWSATSAVAMLLSTAVVSGLTTLAYTDIEYGQEHRSTEALVYLWFPLWGFILGGVLFTRIAVCVWVGETVAAKWRRVA